MKLLYCQCTEALGLVNYSDETSVSGTLEYRTRSQLQSHKYRYVLHGHRVRTSKAPDFERVRRLDRLKTLTLLRQEAGAEFNRQQLLSLSVRVSPFTVCNDFQLCNSCRKSVELSSVREEKW